MNPFTISIAKAVTIATTLPGQASTTVAGQAPGGFINAFYTYALSIAGIIAFGIIVFGGVKYMVSTGNPSATGDAKEWIKAALLGILLLAGAYMILHIVNPSLTNLALPTLGGVAPTTPQGTAQGNAPQDTTVWCGTDVNGQCPNTSDGRPQTCVDNGNSAKHNYSCQPTGSGPAVYTCGDSKLGANGTCAPGSICSYNGDWYCLKN